MTAYAVLPIDFRLIAFSHLLMCTRLLLPIREFGKSKSRGSSWTGFCILGIGGNFIREMKLCSINERSANEQIAGESQVGLTSHSAGSACLPVKVPLHDSISPF